MLEPPAIADAKIIACVQDAYGLVVNRLTFLPLGADVNSAAYRALAEDGKLYFIKLRLGNFDPLGVILPSLLYDQGINQIISPLQTLNGQLWASLEYFRVTMSPFVTGRNGFEVVLSAAQWRDFGAALKRIHTTWLSPALAQVIPREHYSPQYRDMVKVFLVQAKTEQFTDRVASDVAALLQAQEAVILDLIARAENLANHLRAQPYEFVLCHADAHAGNLLIAEDGRLYIVDWDNPILAPKERDLMFIGGAQGFRGVTPQEEEMRFYRGYGPTQINASALAYYRYERIIQDIAAFCEQLLLTAEGGNDRQQSYRYLASNFLPGNTIEVAYNSDKCSRRRLKSRKPSLQQ